MENSSEYACVQYVCVLVNDDPWCLRRSSVLSVPRWPTNYSASHMGQLSANATATHVFTLSSRLCSATALPAGAGRDVARHVGTDAALLALVDHPLVRGALSCQGNVTVV